MKVFEGLNEITNEICRRDQTVYGIVVISKVALETETESILKFVTVCGHHTFLQI